MLADGGSPEPQREGLIEGLHQAGTQFLKLIEFIARHLPRWRDDPKRKQEDAEDRLSEQLCDFLNNEGRLEPGIETFQFQRETRDDIDARRNLDIAVKPVGEWLIVGPRNYSIYDTFLPIECKRLPMPEPKKKDRDHREYVYDQHKSAGGIQRFKACHHGGNHNIGAMIGYVQSDKSEDWLLRVNSWICEVTKSGVDGWSVDDVVILENHNASDRLAQLASKHSRSSSNGDINLKHLWIEM